MAWGSRTSAVDGWVGRLREQDPTFRSLFILPFLPFSHEVRHATATGSDDGSTFICMIEDHLLSSVV